MKLLVLLLLINPHISYAKPLPSGTQQRKNHPLECALMTLQPALAGGEARLISNLIYKSSLKYNVDPFRVIAIGMQESGLKNLNRVRNGIITDVGMFQFNVLTITAYDLDFNRLQTDIAYQIDKACWLLSIKVKSCEEMNDAWACYHSKTVKVRDLYISLVNIHYNKINNILLSR